MVAAPASIDAIEVRFAREGRSRRWMETTSSVAGRDGVAVLTGAATIAGSTLTQDVALRNTMTLMGLTPAQVVAAATVVPARALGLGDRYGLLEPGYAADAVVLDPPGRIIDVWADGIRLAS